MESLDLKKLEKFCAGRALVLLHPSLYRAQKLTFPTDIGGIVLDARIMSNIGTGSLGQSVRFLSPANFHPVYI